MRALILLLALTGCAGPSKARLSTLLGECRQQNREHVRLLQEYAHRDAQAPELKLPNIGDTYYVGPCHEEKVGCNTCRVCGSFAACTAMACAPEQANGSVEYGGTGW